MYKYLIACVLFLTACANFSINGTMCDNIANDPHATMPQECRNYVEAEAEKASKIEKDILSPSDVVEFTKE